MHFLYDAIDLKESVVDILKLWRKSLTTVLDEVHFIVNLYSFPLPLVPQANLSLPKVSHLLPSHGEQLLKLTPLFLLTLFFEVISTPRLESTKR